MIWSCGLTTVPERKDDLLPRTLKSLAAAGFESPRLFVDGASDSSPWEHEFGLEVTVRNPRIRIHGNWILSLYELFIRNPSADRYAIFQDDVIAVKGLREYLEQSATQEKCYWNPFTFLSNEELIVRKERGWTKSNQLGKGAIALIFPREGVKLLLGHQHMVDRVENRKIAARNPLRWELGQEKVDGGIADSFRKSGWSELIHNPSLVQHIGEQSASGHARYPDAATFPGEIDVAEVMK